MVNIDSEVQAVLSQHKAGRGRKPVLPGVVVTQRYKNGQPSTYSIGGQVLTRRQYHVLVRNLQEKGELPPRKTSRKGEAPGML